MSPTTPIRSLFLVGTLGGVLTTACHDGTLPTAPESRSVVAPSSATPIPLFAQVSSGNMSTCALTSAGKAYCWGIGFMLGSDLPDQSIPVPVAGDLVFRQISAGHMHSCAVTTGDRVYCWGNNHFGQLGTGSSGSRSDTPVPVSGKLKFRTVTTGSEHTCALTVDDRRAYCWGRNDNGQLGDGTTTSRPSPRAVSGGRVWRQVSAGSSSTCGITTAKLAFCWGLDNLGQLGDGPATMQHNAPSAVAGGHLFSQIDAGYMHVCAVTTAQRAYCWGFGAFGAIGDGKLLDRFTPRLVLGSLEVARVSAGGLVTCAETTANRTFCWGYNQEGQLGIGFTTDTVVSRPTEIVGPLRFTQVSVGGLHGCGRTASDTTYCWGNNEKGQLGDGTTDNRYSPTQVVGGP